MNSNNERVNIFNSIFLFNSLLYCVVEGKGDKKSHLSVVSLVKKKRKVTLIRYSCIVIGLNKCRLQNGDFYLQWKQKPINWAPFRLYRQQTSF